MWPGCARAVKIYLDLTAADGREREMGKRRWEWGPAIPSETTVAFGCHKSGTKKAIP
jgi:hypothetical protein